MKRAADDEFVAENPDVPNEKRKCTETTQCTTLCERNYRNLDQHNKLITSLVTLEDSKPSKLEEWKSSITEAKRVRDLNKPLEDPDPAFCYPLLHWAAILGKVNAFRWLLQQDFIRVVADPENLKCSQPNKSNAMVLFSAVRYLHVGLPTTLADEIYNKFAKLLDAILKHNPEVLLVQDSQTGDTVLHRCARGEKDSTAPFWVYLKHLIGKIKEKQPIVLQTKNREGHTFFDLLERSERDELSKVIRDFIITNGDEENQSASDQIVEGAGAGEGYRNLTDVPPVAYDMSQSLELLVNASDGGNVFQDSEPREVSANPVERVTSHPVIGTDTREKAQDAVKKLVNETELKLKQQKRKLEKITREIQTCQAKIARLTEEQNGEITIVQRLEEDLKNFEDSLLKLV